MAYNPYQLPINPATFQQPQILPQASSDIIWVQGESGAKSYPVAPGHSVALFDSEQQSFYIKSTDMSGVPLPLRKFNFTEEIPNQPAPSIPQTDFVTKEELEERLSELQIKPSKKEKKDE